MSVSPVRSFDVATALTLLPRLENPVARAAILKAKTEGRATVELEVGWLPADLSGVEASVAQKGYGGSSAFAAATYGGQVLKGYATGAINVVLDTANLVNRATNAVLTPLGVPAFKTDGHIAATSEAEASAQRAVQLASFVVPAGVVLSSARGAAAVTAAARVVAAERVAVPVATEAVAARMAAPAVPPAAEVAATAARVRPARPELPFPQAAPAARRQNLSTRSAQPVETHRIKEHVFNGELDAARVEANTGTLLEKHGRSWNHVGELRAAQNALLNRIKELKRDLNKPLYQFSEAQRVEATRELKEASTLLDKTEGFLPRVKAPPTPK